MKQKRWLILATIGCLALAGLVPLGMQVWAVTVLKTEEQEQTLGIAWNSDPYSTWLAKASLIKDPKCHPVIITIFGESRDAARLARAIPWARHLYSIRILGQQSSVSLLCAAATRVPGLKVMEINEAMLDSASVASLSKLSDLRALHFCTTPAALMDLPALPMLRQLKVASPAPLTAVQIRKLLESPALQFLYLDEAPVTMDDLAAVDWSHSHLKSVELPELAVQDAGMQALVQRMKTQAPCLEWVRLGRSRTFRPSP